jgi:SAM-dependent methyltransferase
MPTVLGSYVRMVPYMGKVARKMLGNHPRHCNLCGFHGKFVAYGFPPRFDAYCPSCGSLERHRLFGLWLDENKEKVAGKDLLHFAPESIVTAKVKPLARTYRTADLDPRYADLVLNIEDIALPERSVDLIICSHVLEHVNPDRSLSQLRRILRQDGFLLLMFPIIEGWDQTYRNPMVNAPEDRELHFGQRDHLQFYGRDVRKSIVGAGFELTEFTAVEPYVSKHGLSRGEKVFIGRRNDKN